MAKTPAACISIENQLKQKQADLNRLNSRPTGGGGNGPVTKPRPGLERDPEIDAHKAKLKKEIAALKTKLNQCTIQTYANAPLTVRFEKLHCGDQDDLEKTPPFDTEDDEPYVLVYALNLPRGTHVNPLNFRPDARMFKVGPFSSVDSGETVWRDQRVWDTNGTPRRITNPDDVYLYVAMMEEDDSGADVVRTQSETLMAAEVLKAAPSLATDPASFRTRLRDGMTGAIKTARRLGVPSRDDMIGQVQEIRLTPELVNEIRTSGSKQIDLHFKSGGARYTATFHVELVA